MKKKKKKVEYIDDGHTVYSMKGLVPDGEYDSADKKAGLNRKEKHAAIKAAMAVYGPIFLLVAACFGVTMLLIYLWLR